MRLTTLKLGADQRKILAFQFLSVAARFAEVGRTANSTQVLDECAAQMREAYDAALSLSIRVSFTADDCGAFDLGSSYIQESFVALRKRAEGIGAQESDPRPGASQWLRDWEPMWAVPGQVSFDSAFEPRTLRRHLKKIEDAAYSFRAGCEDLSGRRMAVTLQPPQFARLPLPVPRFGATSKTRTPRLSNLMCYPPRRRFTPITY